MPKPEGLDDVKKNTLEYYIKKKNVLVQLCYWYAAKALRIFRANQPNEQLVKGYWTNRTMTARNSVFSDVEVATEFVRFFLAHGVDYGIELETGHDRRFEALRPIIESLVEPFNRDLEKLFHDD